MGDGGYCDSRNMSTVFKAYGIYNSKPTVSSTNIAAIRNGQY